MNYDNIIKIDPKMAQSLKYAYNNTTQLDSSIKRKDWYKMYQSFINRVYNNWKCNDCLDITKKLMFTSLSYLSYMKLIPRPKRFKNLDIDIIHRIFKEMDKYQKMIASLDFNNKDKETINKVMNNATTALANFNKYKKDSLTNLYNEMISLSQEIAIQMSFDVNYIPHSEIDKLIMSNFIYCRMGFKKWIIFNEFDIDVYGYDYGEFSEYCEELNEL